MSISKRKSDHIRICLEKKVETNKTGFDNINFKDIDLVHRALPEVNLKDIGTGCVFLGKKLNAPIIISAMTGGTDEAEKINKNIAEAAQSFGIAMGVGSQRAAIENPDLEKTYKVRSVAPDIFLVANLGIIQFNEGYSINEAKKAIEMIDADALALHLNPLQEVCQPEGDTNWGNCLKKIKELCTKLDKPIIVKETGAGISREVAVELKNTGISALDISGSGGTSWSLVENYRNDNGMETFNNWGIPTAVSLIEVVNSVKIPVIASGGIRNGIDIAKALCLGADIVGMALPFLKPATKSGKEVKKLLKKLTIELKTTMFLVGAKNIDELRKKPVVITGKTKEWLESRGVDIKKFSARK